MAGRPAGRTVMAAAEVGLEGGGAPTSLRPDAAMQRAELMPLLKTVLRPGESWYLIDSRWFKQWKKYVGYESWDLYNVGEPNLFPGPIDNSGLFTDSETQTLKEHLIDELDYVLVPIDAWDKLANWYGCMEGQKPIVRKVVEYGLFVKHCKVEVYLLELKLCQNSDPANLVDFHFSKADTIATIEKEMRKQFNIPDGKEVRLWNKCTNNAYEQLSKLDSTIQDAGLYQGQVVLIEVKNEDGSWPRQSSLTKTCTASSRNLATSSKAPASSCSSVAASSVITNGDSNNSYGLNCSSLGKGAEMAEAEKSKKKYRQYRLEYLKYGFIPAPSNQQLPQCLLCEKVFSNEAMKPSRLNEHLQKTHPDKANKNLTFFQSLHDKFQKRPTQSQMFYSASQQNTDGLRASYNISLLIAKSGKPHTIGEELILPTISEVLSTVLHKSPHDIIKTIPLSNNSVQRCIDEMAENVEDVLCSILQITDFTLQLDESTLPGNESLLLAYVRFIKDESLTQELLFARQLKTDTKGESIFHVVEQFFKDKEIPLTNILAWAIDGAPSMTGHYRGCLAYLKKAVPSVLTIHCVIHPQHLVAKNLSDRLHKSLHTVINAVNKIKVHALNDRLFRKLCIENDEDFSRLLLHTEVRWLSKGNCLRRFYNLFDTVVEFFEDKNALLSDELKEIRHNIAYLSELFAKFSEVNLQLQGNEVNLIKAKSVIATFISKLTSFKRNVGRRKLYQFPSLSELEEKGWIQDDDLQVFCDHLDMLHQDMSERYQDLLLMEIPDWVVNPFSDTVEDGVVEEQLIELQNDFELKPKFKKSYQEFWLQKEISDRYPALWTVVKKLLVAFPTSYLVERGFSAVIQLFSKQRNRPQITERGDLRLLLSGLKPDIGKLVSLHQAHPSH